VAAENNIQLIDRKEDGANDRGDAESPITDARIEDRVTAAAVVDRAARGWKAITGLPAAGNALRRSIQTGSRPSATLPLNWYCRRSYIG
jgi:hypothetical protein